MYLDLDPEEVEYLDPDEEEEYLDPKLVPLLPHPELRLVELVLEVDVTLATLAGASVPAGAFSLLEMFLSVASRAEEDPVLRYLREYRLLQSLGRLLPYPSSRHSSSSALFPQSLSPSQTQPMEMLPRWLPPPQSNWLELGYYTFLAFCQDVTLTSKI